MKRIIESRSVLYGMGILLRFMRKLIIGVKVKRIMRLLVVIWMSV